LNYELQQDKRIRNANSFHSNIAFISIMPSKSQHKCPYFTGVFILPHLNPTRAAQSPFPDAVYIPAYKEPDLPAHTPHVQHRLATTHYPPRTQFEHAHPYTPQPQNPTPALFIQKSDAGQYSEPDEAIDSLSDALARFSISERQATGQISIALDEHALSQRQISRSKVWKEQNQIFSSEIWTQLWLAGWQVRQRRRPGL
jgi:hypothetical protein